MNNSMLKPFTTGKIKAALFEMHPNKAPGYDDQDCEALSQILGSYEVASGQNVNKEKSSVFFSPNTHVQSQNFLSAKVGISMEANGAKYLGISVFLGSSKRDLFQYIKDRTTKHLQSYKESKVNQAGHEVLLKSVLLTHPNYAMSCFQ
ncbi:hypothetical protein RHSIM_Rhsim04G0148900 [Rhododendron simsii]|uniref:Uncharacterized protein n=1 Tax=Rhododendron simsii TaxID=118357 RepID=A0A834GZ86_RHOSS|nr:hypothetical protein RHSIM_Rhsim04G0148900 [Rhododendron simsii]